jgi:hypothetical protein
MNFTYLKPAVAAFLAFGAVLFISRLTRSFLLGAPIDFHTPMSVTETVAASAVGLLWFFLAKDVGSGRLYLSICVKLNGDKTLDEDSRSRIIAFVEQTDSSLGGDMRFEYDIVEPEQVKLIFSTADTSFRAQARASIIADRLNLTNPGGLS